MPKIKMSVPDTLRVIEATPGRGGVIELPIARVGTVDLSQTSIGEGMLDITPEFLNEMVENFSKKPGATTVYTHQPHNDVDANRGNSRDDDALAAGTYIGLSVEGDQLWARMNIGPDAWEDVVTKKGYYSFSMEADWSPSFPTTGTIQGWVLTGGIFTNNAALDIHFIAASMKPGTMGGHLRLSMPSAKKEKTMPRSIEELDTALVKMEKTIETLPNAVGKAIKIALDKHPPGDDEDEKKRKAAAAKLLKENPEMAASLAKANKNVETVMKSNVALEASLLGRDVRDAIKDATAEGVQPAFFGEWKDDPVAWLRERFGGSLPALAATIKALPRQSFGKPGVGGGGSPEPEGEMEYGKIKAVGPIADLHALAMSLATKESITYSEAMLRLKLTDPEKYKLAMSRYAKSTGSAQ